jgi:hypothetical protein
MQNHEGGLEGGDYTHDSIFGDPEGSKRADGLAGTPASA